MIFGYEVSRTWVSNLVRSNLGYHPLGRPQAQKGVGKWSPEALACTVLMPQPWILGKLFNILALWINIIGIFWYHPQGRPQAQKGVGKWSPEALACTALMPRPWNLGNLFNIPTIWINVFGIFLYHPQGQLQAQRGVIKWRPEALVSTVLKLFIWFLGILFNMLALWKDIICIFCYHPQGQPRAQEGVGKWIPGALASTVLKLNYWYFGKHTNP